MTAHENTAHSAVLKILGRLLVFAIFCGAAWLLYTEIRKYSLSQILDSIGRIPTAALVASLIFAIINYIILIGYDWLALKAIHKKLSLPKVSLVSFIGQAVSYNFGALLGGSAVRFRFYSLWGFSPMEFVRLILMLAVTFWIGALGLTGALFIFFPPDIPEELGVHLPFSPFFLGTILLAVAVGYLVICAVLHKPLHIFRREFSFPPFHIASAQALVAGADLICAGACLYILLPADSGIGFFEFLPAYLLAMVAVVLTHVPGGAGVLEVIILHLTDIDRQSVLAALICFRVIYYLLPLLLAALIFVLHEIITRTGKAQ
ncbi:MAG: YbhN family protein [Desulfovibrionaceae bacterium]|nr:YbhN family protein [Desulfovibrionaceae bacterium]